ncbi:PREDICTED: 21 kDa protein-like isoform X2 [Camelina sativa]|uniref:21 kDa protein-like isoform X1 n=1 Tax=Camelina sativa TaxID=90675 RepID=A0ABM1QSE9_CAMSA|nr:PREDICTED: 21 kDa protein-like isoform X1 [Camelina sativa]XP_019089687.1 PREDICTED: 21 kDa protein-like isoform X2 [Camelina sativa]
MARSLELSLILSVLYLSTAAVAMARNLGEESSGDIEFIKTSCKTTSYPDLCFQSLSSYASEIKQQPRKLAETALAVSMARAKSAKTYVSGMSDYKGITKRQHEAVEDCIEEMGDTVDRLSNSLKELKHLEEGDSGEDFWFCLSNVRTWTSAALTDETTCLDGFGGKAMDGELKSLIRTHIVSVAEETSNALALINDFASKH